MTDTTFYTLPNPEPKCKNDKTENCFAACLDLADVAHAIHAHAEHARDGVLGNADKDDAGHPLARLASGLVSYYALVRLLDIYRERLEAFAETLDQDMAEAYSAMTQNADQAVWSTLEYLASEAEKNRRTAAEARADSGPKQ